MCGKLVLFLPTPFLLVTHLHLNENVFILWCPNCCSVAGEHMADKGSVVNVAIALDAGITEHLVDLLIVELLAHVAQNVPQFHHRYESLSIFIKHLEKSGGMDEHHHTKQLDRLHCVQKHSISNR